MEAPFGEAEGVEDYLYGGRGGGGEDLGVECCVSYVVKGEAGAVEEVVLVLAGIEVARGHTGLEHEMFVGFRDSLAIVDYG